MASSSSIASPKLYDAFISHRGPDVKDTIAKLLYDLLHERGCRAFLDREEIEGGDSIPFAIANAISSSFVQIAIFSQGYAESKWCLEELVLMLEQTDALFIPVFYDVQPWELRHIENDKSRYAAAFPDYRSIGRYLDKLDEWRKALKSAADISGYELSQHQHNLCEIILSRVLQVVQERKNRMPLDVAKYPVGLAELVQDFERICSKRKRQRNATRARIFGLGGSGKTTLAKELFNRKSSGYHGSCFLSDVRESHARGELHCLQSQLLKDLFPNDPEIEGPKISSVHHGSGKLKDRLGRAGHLNFLIVLDDIDHQDQLDALLPEDMLSSSSLVISTTRDQSMLTSADIRYKMKVLNVDHAKDLFCSHAFRRGAPPTAYEKLIESFLEFCGGLPLSLKVLGAHLYGRDVHYWKLQLEKVKKIQPNDILQRLKVSFDGLDPEEKQIFIDIACFFNKILILDSESKAISIWNACGWSAEHSLQTLQDKCLIEVKGGVFEMHDHIRDLGRQMAHEFGPPRLWRRDILRSMEAKGFKQILAETKSRSQVFPGPFPVIPYDAWWSDYVDFKDLSSWIPLRKMHYLSVSRVKEMWSTFQHYMLQTNTQSNCESQASFELRKLQISYPPSLQKLPDLKGMFNHLEELHINGGEYLNNIDITSLVQSLKQFGNLRSLKLKGIDGVFSSVNLNLSKGSFENSTGSRITTLETIHFIDLVKISKLLISGVIFPRLRSLRVSNMSHLNEMDLQQLETLNTLYVNNCPKLGTISGLSSLTGLQVFEARKCEGLKLLPTLARQRHLERFTILGCDELQSVEGFEKLPGLKRMIIEMPRNGYAWVRNCIYGLRRLPSENTILIGITVDTTLSRLDVNLFSEVIDVQTVIEIERGFSTLRCRSSSAITIYTLLVTWKSFSFITTKSRYIGPLDEGEKIITLLLPHHNSEGIKIKGIIKKGFKVTMNEEEEGKALALMQNIVDRLYGERTKIEKSNLH